VTAGDALGLEPEFLRTPGVERVWGLKKSTLYNLEADGKIKGVLLRVRGQKSGVRLWNVASIRAFVESEVAAQATIKTVHHRKDGGAE
jgi:hypothetical protein